MRDGRKRRKDKNGRRRRRQGSRDKTERKFVEGGKVKKQESEREKGKERKREKTESHWFTAVDPGRFFPYREGEKPRWRRRAKRKHDNVVTREANLLGTLMDDPTTMKLDRRMLPPTERL